MCVIYDSVCHCQIDRGTRRLDKGCAAPGSIQGSERVDIFLQSFGPRLASCMGGSLGDVSEEPVT